MQPNDFQILETLALQNGGFKNHDLHIQRMDTTARYFGYIFKIDDVLTICHTLQQQHPTGDWRVRLALNANGQCETTVVPLDVLSKPVLLKLASKPLANDIVQSDWVRFKTSRRAHYEALQPIHPLIFDTILFNQNGEVTEGTRSNIAAFLNGRWITPPLTCGLLPGVGRAKALQNALLQEHVIRLEDIPQITDWACINSLRGWLDARLEIDASNSNFFNQKHI